MSRRQGRNITVLLARIAALEYPPRRRRLRCASCHAILTTSESVYCGAAATSTGGGRFPPPLDLVVGGTSF